MGYNHHKKANITDVLPTQHKVKQILQSGMTNHRKINLPLISFKWKHLGEKCNQDTQQSIQVRSLP